MVYSLRFFPLQNAVCFIILTYLVPLLFKFYIQGVLKLKKNNSGAKRLTTQSTAVKTRTNCQGSSRQSAAPHRGGLGSIPSESTSNLLWTAWHWDRSPSPYLRFPLSVSMLPTISSISNPYNLRNVQRH